MSVVCMAHHLNSPNQVGHKSSSPCMLRASPDPQTPKVYASHCTPAVLRHSQHGGRAASFAALPIPDCVTTTSQVTL